MGLGAAGADSAPVTLASGFVAGASAPAGFASVAAVAAAVGFAAADAPAAMGFGGAGRSGEQLSADEQALRAEVAYLLGLFLVRKRVLRWGQRTARELSLVLRKGEPMRSYRLDVPSEALLENAMCLSGE